MSNWVFIHMLNAPSKSTYYFIETPFVIFRWMRKMNMVLVESWRLMRSLMSLRKGENSSFLLNGLSYYIFLMHGFLNILLNYILVEIPDV